MDEVVEAGHNKRLQPWSYQHDGLVGDSKWKEVADALSFDGIDLHEKPVPANWPELRKILIDATEVDWPVSLEPAGEADVDVITDDPLARARASMCAKGGLSAMDHAAFAKIVIQHLDKTLILERNDKETPVIQWWNAQTKGWVRAGGGRRLEERVPEVLRKHARPLNPDGSQGAPPTYFGNDKFFRPVANLVKSWLPTASEVPDLDGNQSRGLIRFSCGTVLDLATGKTRPCEARDRMSKSTGYPYKEWQAPEDLKADITKTLATIVERWQSGKTTIEGDMFIEAELRKIKKRSRLLWAIYEITGSWDVCLWIIAQLTRTVGALPGFEEFLWFSAQSGNNGKGTFISILQTVLGNKPDNYYGELAYEKHFLGSGSLKASVNNPEVADLEGKRACIINETPGANSKEPLNSDLVKRLQSNDGQVSATGKYRDPSSWASMMVLFFFANRSPNIQKDPALFTRLSYLFLPFTFCNEPDKDDPMQKQTDTTIKQAYLNGACNDEVFFWACALAPYVMKLKGDRKILPTPAIVVEDTASQQQSSDANAEKTGLDLVGLASRFIEEHMRVWKPGQEETPPKTRGQVNDAFTEFVKHRSAQHNIPNAPESLLGSKLLQNQGGARGTTRFSAKFRGQPFAVYKQGDNIMTLKATPAEAFASSSSTG